MIPLEAQHTLTQPFPAAIPIPLAYRRHAPTADEQRSVLRALVASRDWPSLSWPELVETLLSVGRTDVSLARLAEGHIDAVRILDQGEARPTKDALYGVWASRSEQTGVRAEPTGTGGLRLDGTLRFASGAGVIDRALVPVWRQDGRHLLLDLDVRTLPIDTSVWRTSAMAASRTHVVDVNGLVVGTEAQIGSDDFYLGRPGFFPGGVGVAACWVGGAARLTDLLRRRHSEPNPAQQDRMGRIRVDLVLGAAAVRSAAHLLQRLAQEGANPMPAGTTLPSTSEPDWQAIATEARLAAAEAVRRILAEARLLTGPAGMAMDEPLSRAVPDLELYVLQENPAADAALLGDPERWV